MIQNEEDRMREERKKLQGIRTRNSWLMSGELAMFLAVFEGVK